MLDLLFVLNELGRRGFNDLFVEGGSRIASALILNKVVDELVIYQAPSLLGCSARSMFEVEISRLADRERFRSTDVRQIGSDIRITMRRELESG